MKSPRSIRSGSNRATAGLKKRIKSYHLRKLFKKGVQVFDLPMTAIRKIGSDAHAGLVVNKYAAPWNMQQL